MQMYLSPILEYVTAEDQTLKFVGESGVPINLLSIVTPHQFTSVQTSRTADTYKISIGVTDEIEELAIEAVEMVSGRRETIDLRVDVLDSATGRAMEKVWAASHGTLRVGLGREALGRASKRQRRCFCWFDDSLNRSRTSAGFDRRPPYC